MIITFPSRYPGGTPWSVRISGNPSEPVARRAAIEHAARIGEALHFLSLDGMDLSEGHYDGLKLVNCSAVGVNWSGSKMAGATFEGCAMTVDNNGCAMSRSLFERVQAQGASFTNCDLHGSLWNDADATEAAFSGVNFRDVAARGLRAPRSVWSSVRTSGANFRGADLAYADLGRVDDREAILAQCDMPEHIKAGTRCVAVGSSIENAQKFAAQILAETAA